jgi:hypothetical protein
MTKRVVFAGGVQAKALAKAYRLDVALDTDEDVFFIGAESITREAARRVVGAADVLVTDLSPAGPTVPDDMVQVGTLRIAVPVATCDFLWPFAARPHPLNAPAPGLPDGPYPSGFGDSWLDTLAHEGLDEDTCVGRYLTLDIAAAAKLDETLQANLEKLAKLDAETGFDLADFIADRFRKQVLFTTRDHLGLALFRHVAARLFGQMGIAPSRLSLIAEAYFPSGEMPIHPGILAHFGMETPAPDRLYPMLDEGYFSFEEYCRRYLRFEWNRLLHAAIAKAESNPSEAIPQLRLALETSPLSRTGQRALERAERAVSDASMLPPLALAPPPAAKPAPAPPPAATPQPVVAPPVAFEAEPSIPEPALPLRRAEPPPEPQDDEPAPASLVPRAAFGSSLVSRPSYVPLEPDEEEAPPADSNHAPLPALGLAHWGRPAAASFAPGVGGTALPLAMFPAPQSQPAAPVRPPTPAELLPEQQSYVELPLTPFEPSSATQSTNMPMTRTNRYTPLAPAEDLIPLLPSMLPNTRSMAGTVDKPFNAMPESMPPPPLRPVLPPELHPEPVKTSLMSKLLDQLRK